MTEHSEREYLTLKRERRVIRITKQGAAALERGLLSSKVLPTEGLRLIQDGGSLGLILDTPREEDAVLDCLGMPVLISGPQVIAALDGAMLEVDGDPAGGIDGLSVHAAFEVSVDDLQTVRI